MSSIVNYYAFPQMTINPAIIIQIQRYSHFIPITWKDSYGNEIVSHLGVIDFTNRDRLDTSAVLFLQGNTGFMHSIIDFNFFCQLHVLLKKPILVFDYPGRGIGQYRKQSGSQEKASFADRILRGIRGLEFNDPLPTVDKMLKCAEKVMEFILEQTRFTSLFLYGQSLGSHAACHLVEKFKDKDIIKGVILHSPISSSVRVATGWMGYPIQRLDWTDNVAIVGRNSDQWPQTLIFHGTLDKDVEPENGETLAGAIPQDKVVLHKIPDRNHHNIKIDDISLHLLSWFQRFRISE